MTSLDEALRALEKKWRERAESIYSVRRNDAGDCVGVCANELAALLTTRQEVAPVAMRIVLPRGSTSGWEDYDAERIPKLRENGWNVELAYPPTGQTSDARDGVAGFLDDLVNRGVATERPLNVVIGELVEIGDDDGELRQPRILIHADRSELAKAGNLLFRKVMVIPYDDAAMQEAGNG